MSLTKVNSKGRELKETTIETLRASMDGNSNLFHPKQDDLIRWRYTGSVCANVCVEVCVEVCLCISMMTSKIDKRISEP